jgi:RNA 2',3'-cyclic 3'-phosphodiesterase
MRLFVALDIEEAIRARIERFVEGVRGFAPDARWVRAESLHVTLKFIGEKPDDAVEAIKSALMSIQQLPVEMTFRGYGFFPTPKAARVFWAGLGVGPELGALAKEVDGAMTSVGVPQETHTYSPHLTLARGGGGSGAPGRQRGDRANRNFFHLQEKLSARPVPEFGTMTAREFFLYRSETGRGGSRYTKIAAFALQPS